MQNSKFKIQNFLFLIIFLGGLFLPLVSLAGEYTGVRPEGTTTTVQYQGLVPCGKTQPDPGESPEVTMPCQLCHLFVMGKGIIDFVWVYIVFPAAILLLVIGGTMFLLYAESPQRVEQAKTLLTSVVIGLVLIFAAWLIIGLFFTAIGVSDFALQFTGPDQWFTIDCPIEL